MGLILGLGRSPEEGNGNPLQYSCLENSMNRGVWWTIVHGVSKSCTCQWLDSNNRGDLYLFIYLWENDSIINILLKKLKPHDMDSLNLFLSLSKYVCICVQLCESAFTIYSLTILQFKVRKKDRLCGFFRIRMKREV